MRPIAWVVMGILILALVVTLSYLYSAQSSPAGKRTIKTLGDSVVITFDEADIPHIKANSQSDALFALGYLHATERSWQMEINRRLASGRLSEILGSETVSIDRFIRTLGIKRAAEHQLINTQFQQNVYCKRMQMA